MEWMGWDGKPRDFVQYALLYMWASPVWWLCAMGSPLGGFGFFEVWITASVLAAGLDGALRRD